MANEEICGQRAINAVLEITAWVTYRNLTSSLVPNLGDSIQYARMISLDGLFLFGVTAAPIANILSKGEV